MASSIAAKTLTVTINESISLGSDDFNNRTQFEVKNVSEVTQRVMSVPTHQVSILTLSSSAGAGTYASGSLKYVRITNLDNENHIRLTFMSSSDSTTKNKSVFKLDPLRSFVVTNDSYSGSSVGTSFGSFQSFQNIKAKSDSASCDIELFVAST